jgi:Notch-like protein
VDRNSISGVALYPGSIVATIFFASSQALMNAEAIIMSGDVEITMSTGETVTLAIQVTAPRMDAQRAFLSSSPAQSADGSLRYEILPISGLPPTDSATVTALQGPRGGPEQDMDGTDQRVFGGVRRPPARSTAVLASSPTVYFDGPTVRLAVQSTDQFGYRAVDTSGLVARARLVPSAALALISSVSPEVTCVPSSITGACSLGIDADAAWFKDGGGVTVQQRLEIDGVAITDYSTVATLSLLPRLPLAQSTASVLLQLPLRDVFFGEIVELPVWVWAEGEPIDSFFVVFEINPLDMSAGSLVDASFDEDEWVVVQTVVGGVLRVSGRVADPLARPSSMMVPEEIFRVRLRIANSGSATRVRVSGTIRELNTVQAPAVTPETQVHVYDRGTTFLQRQGSAYLARDQAQGAFITLDRPVLAHTAVLTGISQQAVAQVLHVFSENGDIRSLGADAVSSCRQLDGSDADDDVHVLTRACGVVLGPDTSALMPATLGLEFTTAQFSITVTLMIYSLDQVRLEAETTELGAVSNLATPSCELRFQSTVAQLMAMLVSGASTVGPVDLSAAVPADRFAVDNSAILRLTSAMAWGRPGYAVEALAFGSAAISLTAGGRTWVDQLFQVLKVSVPATHIEVSIATPFIVGELSYSNAEESASFVVRKEPALRREYERRTIVATLVLANGLRLPLNGASGLTLINTATSLVNVTESEGVPYVVALSTGYAAGIRAVLPAIPGCPESKAITGVGMVRVQLPPAIGVDVSASATRLARAGSVAAAAGVATSGNIQVQLKFADAVPQDVTADPRTRYTASSSRLAILRNNDGTVSITAPAGGTTGQALLFISFDHVNLTATIPVEVVVVDALVLSVAPFPRFPGDAAVQASPLNLIAETGVTQTAILSSALVFSDGLTQDVSAVAAYTTDGSIVSIDAASRVVSVTAPGTSGVAQISATFGGLSSAVSVLSVTPTKVEVDSINFDSSRTFPSTFSVVKNGARYIRAGVTLSDRTQFPLAVLSPSAEEAPIVSSLLEYESSVPEAIQVDRFTGLATLLQNLDVPVQLTVSARSDNSKVNRSLSTFANLAPATGDVDLGASSGTPLPELFLGSSFVVPVRIHCGGEALTAVQLAIVYNETLLRVLSVEIGSDWPGGQFIVTRDDPPGEVLLGGLPQGLEGDNAELARITFEVADNASPGAVVSLGGTVVTMAYGEGDGQADLTAPGTPFVAGQVSTVLQGTRRRRSAGPVTGCSIMADMHALSWQRRLRRNDGPCTADAATHPLGDANGDCIFDLKDATFVQYFLVQRDVDSNFAASLTYPVVQSARMDGDGDGDIRSSDASYLANVAFRLYRHIADVEVRPVSRANNCSLSVTVALQAADGSPALASQTRVFVDLEAGADSAEARSQLLNSTVTTGSLALRDKGAGFSGAIYLAAPIGGGRFQVALDSAVTAVARLGATLAIVTLDANGMSSIVRTRLLTGAADRPWLYDTPLDVVIDVDASLSVALARPGYQPLQLVATRQTTAQCLPDLCETEPCLNGADCTQNGRDVFCACAPGFFGLRCETDEDDCASQPCANGGVCIDVVNGFLCDCADGWAGETCVEDVDECVSAPCLNGGTCNQARGTNSYNCTCAAGYEGQRCERDIDECLGDPCGITAGRALSCFNQRNAFFCTCASGFTGPDCSMDVDECSSEPCLNGGACSHQLDSFVCDCAGTGFTGTVCETEINECSSSPCLNGATCTDLLLGYSCSCSDGFAGRLCQEDLCLQQGCANGANCVIVGGIPECVCVNGFRGSRCETAPEPDEPQANASPSEGNEASPGIYAAVGVILLVSILVLIVVVVRKRRTEVVVEERKRNFDWEDIDESEDVLGSVDGRALVEKGSFHSAVSAPQQHNSTSLTPVPGMDFMEGSSMQGHNGAYELERLDLGTISSAKQSRNAQLAFLEEKLEIDPTTNQPACVGEFQLIQKKKQNASFRAAKADVNQRKNRYRDILPYDDTRVRLNSEKEDYINANHLSMNAAGRNLWYIAAQGPLKHTIKDFWQMVWEQGSKMIVMVAAEVEKGVVKCERYWPSEEGENGSVTYGSFKITLTKQAANDAYAIRGLRVKSMDSGEKRTIWHLQYTTWPDHGVPRSPGAFLAFIDEVNSVRTRLTGNDAAQPAWPTVTHCSAGIGRTGVLVLVETALAKIAAGETPDLGSLLVELREQRPSLVQTAAQYKFCFTALKEALLKQESEL